MYEEGKKRIRCLECNQAVVVGQARLSAALTRLASDTDIREGKESSLVSTKQKEKGRQKVELASGHLA